jgi:hypothetical protein
MLTTHDTADGQAIDLVDNTEAKQVWQRAKPPGQVIGLPGYLVGGEFIGVSLGLWFRRCETSDVYVLGVWCLACGVSSLAYGCRGLCRVMRVYG